MCEPVWVKIISLLLVILDKKPDTVSVIQVMVL